MKNIIQNVKPFFLSKTLRIEYEKNIGDKIVHLNKDKKNVYNIIKFT